MKFKPIQKKKRIYEDVIQQIEVAVENKIIKPGDKLPSERYLAEIMGVSRTSIKEAVTVLESSGIITVRPGVGMFLNENTEKELLKSFSTIFEGQKYDFLNLIELRQAVESDAAYYAASRITEQQKSHLHDVFQLLLQAEKDGKDGIQEDYQFHFAIMEATNNPVMLNVMNLVSDRIIRNLKASREKSIKDDFLNNQVMEEHRKIFQAIINSQPDVAKKAMWEHHQASKQRYMTSSLTESRI